MFGCSCSSISVISFCATRLRDHPDIVLELKRFWKFVAQDKDATFMLKSNYIEMHICMYVRGKPLITSSWCMVFIFVLFCCLMCSNKGLRQDFESQQLHDDLRKLALWDWNHDMENAKVSPKCMPFLHVKPLVSPSYQLTCCPFLQQRQAKLESESSERSVPRYYIDGASHVCCTVCPS